MEENPENKETTDNTESDKNPENDESKEKAKENKDDLDLNEENIIDEEPDFEYIPLPKTIYNPLFRKNNIQERFNMTPQEYLDSFKIGVYFQDVIKIILDRKEEKPLELLAEYFSATLKGEHILLREYAFISATEMNRKCFLQQVKKVFHTTPYYSIVTALDYHQMLCLICSDFPRSLIIESAKILPQAANPLEQKEKQTQGKTERESEENKEDEEDPTGEKQMFALYSLNKIQKSVAVFFFYHEFMENVKNIFQELQISSTLNITETCSIKQLFNSIQNFIKRVKLSTNPLPSIEAIVEVLAQKINLHSKFEELSLVVVSDIIPHLNGKISYIDFCQSLIMNPTINGEIYSQMYSRHMVKLHDQLKEIASEHSPAVTPHQGKKTKKKKKP